MKKENPMGLCASTEETFDYDNNRVSVTVRRDHCDQYLATPGNMFKLYRLIDPGHVMIIMDPFIEYAGFVQKGTILQLILRLPSEAWVVCEVNCQCRVVHIQAKDLLYMRKVRQSD